MKKTEALSFHELESMDAPITWWETAGYAIAVAGGLVAIAAT
jgi:hypothetical protein